METVDCDRCGTTVAESDIHTDGINVLCQDCWRRSQDVEALEVEA